VDFVLWRINPDGVWDVSIHSKRVPATCSVFSDIPRVASPDDIAELMKIIDGCTLCPGNADAAFVKLYKSKGGNVRGARGRGEAVAYVDDAQSPHTIMFAIAANHLEAHSDLHSAEVTRNVKAATPQQVAMQLIAL